MSQKWKNLDLETLPGHNVRRIHQLVVALFFDELKEFNLTPVQYSLLQSEFFSFSYHFFRLYLLEIPATHSFS